MDHAKLETGETLFDALHCRNVEIVGVPGEEDLRSGQYFVKALDSSRENYVLDEKYLFSRDEMSTILTDREVVDQLNRIRKERFEHHAPLLQHIDFDPAEVSTHKIEEMKQLEVALDRIWKMVKKEMAKKIWSTSEPHIVVRSVAHEIVDLIQKRLKSSNQVLFIKQESDAHERSK